MTLKVTTWYMKQKDLVDHDDVPEYFSDALGRVPTYDDINGVDDIIDDARRKALDEFYEEAEDYLLATVGIPMDNLGRVRMDLVEPSAGSRCHEHEPCYYDPPRGTGFRKYTY
tara:strand:+ start:638 stop:976 length:339 start_codon:yes stop_codon:yes gene_type:complete